MAKRKPSSNKNGPQGPKRVGKQPTNKRKTVTKPKTAKIKVPASRKAAMAAKVAPESRAEQDEKTARRKKLTSKPGKKPASSLLKGSKKSHDADKPKPAVRKPSLRARYPEDPITWAPNAKGTIMIGYANEIFEFEVKAEDIKIAKCGNPEECVVARALRRAGHGLITGFEVGSKVTHVYLDGGRQVVCYGTSSPLSQSLRAFDKTGQWPLDPGTYWLLPYPNQYRPGARESRWDKMRHSGGVQSKRKVFIGHAKMPPTRDARTSCMISAKLSRFLGSVPKSDLPPVF
jgi:hypothetical protein